MGISTYWSAVRDSFISDDFTMLPSVRALMANPAEILNWPSEAFRAVSYIYFAICVKAFGSSPEPFYWTGIVLHILVSLLVGKLVFTLTRNFHAAWAAALFFVVYERHQEAVMWISAVNDTLLTLFGVLFLLLWERSLSHPSLTWNALALLALFVAMFSKEGWVALVPLAIFLTILRGWPWQRIVRRAKPLLMMVAVYAVLWLSSAQRNFFIKDGHYALSGHALPVFLRTFVRLLSPVLLVLLPLLVWRNFSSLSRLLRIRIVQFFLVMLALSIIPYSFLTYLDHLPSRNTYLPSVAVAALVGILFVAVLEMARDRARPVLVGFFTVIVLANSLYIWIKKEPQFRERAAPTRELIAILNEQPPLRDEPVYVCRFPLHVWIGQTAVEGFTQLRPGRVVFEEECRHSGAARVLRWDAVSQTYTMENFVSSSH